MCRTASSCVSFRAWGLGFIVYGLGYGDLQAPAPLLPSLVLLLSVPTSRAECCASEKAVPRTKFAGEGRSEGER